MDLIKIANPAKSSGQNPAGQFGTQAAQWANSAAPGAAALSNTVPSYATIEAKMTVFVKGVVGSIPKA